jgi:putative nucleotidyltransferase with HDIG domain
MRETNSQWNRLPTGIESARAGGRPVGVAGEGEFSACLHVTLGGPACVDATLRRVAHEAIRDLAPGNAAVLSHDTGPWRVLLPAAPLADVWDFADRLRRRIDRLTRRAGRPEHAGHAEHAEHDQREPVARAFVGIGESGGTGRLSEAVARADHAAAHARANPLTPIATWQMAEFDEHLRLAARRLHATTSERRLDLLRRCDALLGPTQRDHVTWHCDQVSYVATKLARRLGLDDLTVERVRLAGLLHDIGKCVVPEDLLAKPAALTPREWSLMNLHTDLGADICARLGCDGDTMAFVRHHHTPFEQACAGGLVSWWAGGRGSRMGGDDGAGVPLGARLICAADAFATMLTHRSYRPARPLDDALAEMARHGGRQFDPHVVGAMQAVAASEWRLAA